MEEITIKTGLVDYKGETNGGVSIIVSFTLYDYSFEGVYWIHPDGYRTLETEPKFLKLFGVDKVDDLPFLELLLNDIDKILPEKKEIFKEFLTDGETEEK